MVFTGCAMAVVGTVSRKVHHRDSVIKPNYYYYLLLALKQLFALDTFLFSDSRSPHFEYVSGAGHPTRDFKLHELAKNEMQFKQQEQI